MISYLTSGIAFVCCVRDERASNPCAFLFGTAYPSGAWTHLEHWSTDLECGLQPHFPGPD
eukprot:3695580-Prymnesium_polylepis.1